MSWVAVAIGASAVVGAAGSAYASNSASDASIKGSKQALAEQQRQFGIGLNMYEPQRSLGYGALSDLASLYGYNMPQYQTANQLLYGNYGQPIGVKGNVGGGSGGGGGGGPFPSGYGDAANTLFKYDVALNPSGILNNDPKPVVGGTINPYTGTVDAQGGSASRDAVFSEYLRTGEWTGDPKDRGKKKYQNLISAIDRLRAGGYEYQDPATAPPTAGPLENRNPQTMLDRIQQMPGYQFGMQQGQQALDRSAAARGSVLGGNALRATTQFGQDYAGTKFNEEFNRLMAMAGLGQVATTGSASLSQNYGVNAGNLLQQQGDARASGIMGAWNGAANSLNSGINSYLMYRGGYFGK